MICLLLIAFGTLLSDSGFVIVTEAQQAKILLRSVSNKSSPNAFELNLDVLKEISQMEPPIRVIAAVGNARVGKSTFLNLVGHILDEKRTSSVIEEVFKTGTLMKAVTRDVWAYVIHQKEGSMLLLDVEGTDLGDDTVTDRLSMFTAMMSSRLNVFAVDFVGNADTDFLYRMARLSYLVFKDKNILDHFPKLQIVLRTNLGSDGDYNFKEIISGETHKGKEDKMETIYQFFPKDSIAVTRIPYVHNAAQLFRDQNVLENSSAWKAFKTAIEKIKESPEKKTFEGSSIDGEALSDLAERLVQIMNNDSWEYFGNVYETWERDICRKSYKEHIEPVLKRRTSIEIQDEMIEASDKFKRVCNLKEEIENAKEDLKRAGRNKKKFEEEEKQRKEEKRKRDEESWLEYGKTAIRYLGTFIAGAYIFSDKDLKDNLTTLSSSEFNNIGLRGVCWEWNENAQKTFGLTGEDCGVIAQEVKVLYPWAVTAGTDGYLRVHYGILYEMINVAHSNRNL
nr:uncharacterized protein LOC131780960 [Pocillopora verrucosa]